MAIAPRRHLHSLTEIERIACACHQANKALCEAFGDHSQHDWDHISEGQRVGTVSIVRVLIANHDIPSSAENSPLERAKDNVFRAIVFALA